MNIKKGLKEEKNIFKDIIERIKKRDFSGNTGIVLKNTIYQTTGSVVAKIGALIFTIILARLLMPELFGLYSLALSTIMLFTSFSNIGIGETFVTFVSKELGKNNKSKAKAYASYLLKIKIIFLIVALLTLLFSTKFISDVYYQKPLFLALIAGIFYILFFELGNFLGFIFQSTNDFKTVAQKEIIFQFSRIILVPLAILLSLKYSLSNEEVLFYVILMLAFSYLISSLFILSKIKKIDFIRTEKEKLNKNKKDKINQFLLITSVLVFSGIFFSLIDKVMLGRFVEAEYIGYYSAAFGLISALSALIGFSSVLLPIFSRLDDKKIIKGMRRSIKIFFILGICMFLITLIFAPIGINIAYGKNYVLSIGMLRFLSPLLAILPLISLYNIYFISRRKPIIIAKMLIFSTIINIVLNYILISSFIKYGYLMAVYGAGIATIISQFIYLFGLMFYKKNFNN